MTVAAYPARPGSKVSGPSRDAAESVTDAATLRDQALAALRRQPMTADEIAAVLHRSVLAIRPRISELVRLGSVEATAQRRPNASGRPATVWRVVPVRGQAELFA